MTRSRRNLAYLVLVATAALLATSFLYGVTPDDEEYGSAILSAQLHARALLQGHYLVWTSQLGLGLPQPLGPSFFFHPLMPLLAVLPADTWVALLLSVHLALAVEGTWRLGHALGLSAPARMLTGMTLLLATPVQNYVLTDFWPTVFVSWTLMPWLLLGVIQLVDDTRFASRYFDAAKVGLLSGLIVANGHPGYLLVYAPTMAVFLAPHWRTIFKARGAWTLALGIGGLIALPTLVYLASEVARFPPGLARLNYGRALAIADLADVVMRPFSASISHIFADPRALGTRTLFFGGPFALLAVVGLVQAARGRIRRDLAVAAVASLVLMAVPNLDRIRFFPATYLFRDPLILFAVLLAALALDSLLRGATTRRLCLTAAVLQIVVLVAGVWPWLSDTWQRRERAFPPGATIVRGTPLTLALADTIGRNAGRIYFSADIDREVRAGELRRDGLHRNSLAYIGLSVVNGTFKGVSADGLYPSTGMPYGAILNERAVQLNQALLDVAGIRYLVALPAEQVAPGLVRRRVLTNTSGPDLAVWENPTVWPGASLIDRRAEILTLVPKADCHVTGFLCMDVEPFRSLRREGATTLENTNGHIVIEFQPSAEGQLLFVSEMYRPGWRANLAGAAVKPAFGGAMFVEVPPNTSRIELDYRPRLRLLLSGVAWVTMLAAGLSLLWRRRTDHFRSQSQ